MKNSILKKKWALISILMAVVITLPSVLVFSARAAEGYGFTVTPMNEKLVLSPGEHYSSTVSVLEPSEYETDIKYEIEVAPYFVDDDYKNDFENEYGTSNEIVKWITINSAKEGRLSPGEKVTINYTIDVPEDAAGGGQYASILVSASAWSDTEEDGGTREDGEQIGVGVIEKKKIAHVILVEVAGKITRQGEISNLDVPGFLLNGNITASSLVKNSGNTHGDAYYKLQVFPLFSSEEVFTNEEDPASRIILPGRTRLNEIAWDKTPAIGIFNVVYTVEFEGVTAQVKKMVIKCPVWLLFIIIFAIALIIIYFILKAKARNNRHHRSHSDVE